jgi:hypothetical protein
MVFRIPSTNISVEVDDEKETVTIEGVKYSYQFFKYMKDPDPEQLVRVACGNDGMRFIVATK